MAPEHFDYVAPVLHLGDGIRQWYLPVPDDIAERLLEAGTRRVVAQLNDFEVKRALHRKKDGEWYLVMSKPILRDAKASPGDMVVTRISSDPNPDSVDLAEEFVAVLEQDSEAAGIFYGMTPGMQRSIAHYVDSAKREPTRIKRALEMAHKIRTRSLHRERKQHE